MMRDHEWRALRVIESGLRAEAPELAALLDRRAAPARGPGRLLGPHRRLLPVAGLLLLGLLVGDPTASLGALALLAMWAVPWTVYPDGSSAITASGGRARI